jgi:hypothetical protein
MPKFAQLCSALLRTLWLATAFPVASSAQVVGGTVRDAVSSSPVAGAVVTLLGANREVLARTLSSSTGAFRLTQSDAVVIRVVRIGFQPFEQRLPGATNSINVVITPLGRALRPVSVTANRVCPSRSDQREALALWASATDALLAMVVASTESADSGSVLQLMYNRVFDNSGRRGNIVYWDRLKSLSSYRVLTGNAEPIRAERTPGEFVSDGYVVNHGESTTYYGPDPEVLLDSSFAETHCLSLRERRGEVGVAFVPTRDRDSIPDIAGVLWMSQQPLALRSLTFEYSGLPRTLNDARAGGQLDFETMTNGLPVIRSWHIRTPRVSYIRTFRVVDHQTVFGRTPTVGEVHETGGMIASGRLADGTVLTSVLASLGGRVLNGRTGEGVPAATVTIDSTDQKTTTDAQGQFSFETLLPGPYVVRVRDSLPVFGMRVDSLRNIVPDSSITQQLVTRTATLQVEAKLGEVAPRDLRLDWRAPISGCGQNLNVERRYTVIGSVITTERLGVPGARIRLSWADTTRTGTVETTVDATTDLTGTFVACGIPTDRRLGTRVSLSSGAQHLGTTLVQRPNNEVMTAQTVTITIPPQE